MDWDSFTLGFWHPFGRYCGLTTHQILDWKRRKASEYGWTLWSFVHTAKAMDWYALLKDHYGPIHALCSYSPPGPDPKPGADQLLASHYRPVHETEWVPMPQKEKMNVTNPFKHSGFATAFVVRRVEAVDPCSTSPLGVSWYSRSEGRWRDDPIPTRGEFLLRRGGAARLRPVAAVLELQPPYLAFLKCEAVAPRAR